MREIYSYPKVYALGHRSVQNVFEGCYSIEEKVDGSQFSFGISKDGDLFAKSKGATLDLDNPESLFSKAVEYVKYIKELLTPEWVYRAEYLSKPKHNTLSYERVPKNWLMLFDIEDLYGNPVLSRGVARDEAERLGIELVPQLGFYCGHVLKMDHIDSLLEEESVLGNEKIEGIVIKNREQETPDKKYVVAKYVSERFKERHDSSWKDRNPNRRDVVEILIANLKTEAKYHKALQHLRDKEMLNYSPKDIGALMKEVQMDIDDEDADYIKDTLYKKFIKDIKKGVCKGLPEWYKRYLVEKSY